MVEPLVRRMRPRAPFGARYYDASQARFTQTDPSGQEANPYAYANCNPVNAKDPSGLSAECTESVVGLVASIAGLGASVVGVVLSAAATVPSFGASVALGVAGVVGLSASTVGLILSISSTIRSC